MLGTKFSTVFHMTFVVHIKLILSFYPNFLYVQKSWIKHLITYTTWTYLLLVKKNYFRFPWTFNKCALLTFLSKICRSILYSITLYQITMQATLYIMIMNFVRWSQVSKNMNTLNWSSTFLYVSMLLLQDIMCMIKYCVFRWLFVNCTTKNPMKVLTTKNFL